MQLIAHPHLLVRATSERFLPAGGTFRAILASESHWLQPVLVLSVHWWPGPAGVGRVLIAHPHLLVRAKSEWFLLAQATFRAGLTSESHSLQPMMVLSVHWWPVTVSAGGLLGGGFRLTRGINMGRFRLLQ